MKRIFILAFFTFHFSLFTFHFSACHAQTSPNGKVRAKYVADKGIVISYKAGKAWQTIMTMPTKYSRLSDTAKGKVEYDMLLGKKSHCTNAYTEGIYMAEGSDNKDLLFVKVYNDGVAFAGPKAHDFRVDFTSAKNNWLMSWSDSYEGFFPKNRQTVDPGLSPREGGGRGQRYGYPALFEYPAPVGGSKEGAVFALISESRIHADNAATSMWATETDGVFDLRPDGPERGGSQTIIIGSLADIVESTLITDNSEPCPSSFNSQLSTFNSPPALPLEASAEKLSTLNWVHPGVAAWVYWAYNHGSNDYNIIKKYTDMAVQMRLPYVLIDAEWDRFIAPYKVEDAVKYAVDRGVKPIIWYSSSIGWINGAPTPMFRLNKPEDREKEFAWCEKIGIKGVKIDFFSGDTNQNIRFMIELLECAAKHHLLVNFHGATVPRGWQRTYPNLVSTEGVYGAEWYNNVPTFTKRAAAHNATLPFTRNVIGSMDYTPCAFTDSQHPHITTHGHELALTALYESGIQHLADRPESFLAQPQAVQNYLSELPTAWDETRLLSGYPGDNVVMARRKGTTWYIAGINGNDTSVEAEIPTVRLKGLGTKVRIFTDSNDPANPWLIKKLDFVPSRITLKPRGGFVVVVNR